MVLRFCRRLNDPSDQPLVGISDRFLITGFLQSHDTTDNDPDNCGQHAQKTDENDCQHQRNEAVENAYPKGPDSPDVMRLHPTGCLCLVQIGDNNSDNAGNADNEAEQIQYVNQLDVGFARFEPVIVRVRTGSLDIGSAMKYLRYS